ncbi:hypothetical protein BEH94_02495 [Candidatus Altiarchaeales archaeon WOR_SM1_SCG]|nr:hypothetical protein BEH94_02495 [Candidatus Altiarchaeales archaeon WOR_SM1_SCG]
MTLKENIITTVNGIINTDFEEEEVNYVPDIKDPKLTFGNKGLLFEGTVLYIDMRGSTEILNNHHKKTVAKIHISYFHTIVKIAKEFGGEVRSFNGDSMLVFFPGTTQESLSNGVKAAMKMRYMLADPDSGINKTLKKYSPIDFGIGIDYGKILCTKIGIGGDSTNKDLVWIGNAVNKSTRLGDTAKLPDAISISSHVYNNLLDYAKCSTEKNWLGQDVKVNMWKQNTFAYNNQPEYYYYTHYRWPL